MQVRWTLILCIISVNLFYTSFNNILLMSQELMSLTLQDIINVTTHQFYKFYTDHGVNSNNLVPRFKVEP